jgi:hypothetical protein
MAGSKRATMIRITGARASGADNIPAADDDTDFMPSSPTHLCSPSPDVIDDVVVICSPSPPPDPEPQFTFIWDQCWWNGRSGRLKKNK